MTAAGLNSLFPVGDFSIIGFAAIPRRLPRIVRRMAQTVRAVLARRPHALVIIDSPAFTLRVARYAHWFDRSIPIIDYVSPSVWAWRPGRACAMSSYIDHVLALLPFEPDVHRSLGGPPCSYVGHPLIDTVRATKSKNEFCRAHNLDPAKPILALLPGSRKKEIRYILPTLCEVANRIRTMKRDTQFVLPAAPNLDRHLIEELVRGTSIRIISNDTYNAIRYARAAIVASGTATLETALLGTPEVIVYRISGSKHGS